MTCVAADCKNKKRPWRSAPNDLTWLKRKNTNSSGRSTKRSTAIRVGILLALEAGPATVEQIRQRMGIAPPSSEIAQKLRMFEHRGIVKIVARIPVNRAPPVILWALVEALP